MKKNHLLLLFPLLLLLLMTLAPVFVQAKPTTFNKDIKIYDYAQLFTQTEKNNLSQIAQDIAKNERIDIAVVTTNKPNGKTSRDYADDFYDAYQFGYGEDRSGLIMLINMKEREIWISTTGKAIDIFTDQKINLILDSIYIDLAQNHYFNASKQFLELSESYIEQQVQSTTLQDIQDNIPAQIMVQKENKTANPALNKPTSTSEKLLESLKLGTTMGGIIIFLLTLWNKQKISQAPNAHTYLDEKGFVVTLCTDDLVDSKVTRTHIPQESEHKPLASNTSKNSSTSNTSTSSPSTTHQSLSGTTHGGAGRKF
ncbi:TPM domain-containing protein [Neisseria sp. Ec49-e6-T10]|uniref:TPM domain-containing protein n=1 Tax=Neisseria sp. Ec49-e6-T10 TaxID=3140744 RepID=UPI003EBB4C07